MYIAYLCFENTYDDEDDYDTEVKVVFQEPSRYLYKKVLPISFSILHEWAEKDKDLYK